MTTTTAMANGFGTNCWSNGGNGALSSHVSSKATSALFRRPFASMEAYAQHVIKRAATEPPDDSLGGYVTTFLKEEESEEEWAPLIELLTEHGHMTPQVAKKALVDIAQVVHSGVIPNVVVDDYDDALVTSITLNDDNTQNGQLHSGPQQLTAAGTSGITTEILAGGTQTSSGLGIETATEGQSASSAAASTSATGGHPVLSPLHEDNLIPVDLLGALEEDENEEQEKRRKDSVSSSSERTASSSLKAAAAGPYSSQHEDSFPPLGAASTTTATASSSASSTPSTTYDSVNFPASNASVASAAQNHNPYAYQQNQACSNTMPFHNAMEYLLSMNALSLSDKAATYAIGLATQAISARRSGLGMHALAITPAIPDSVDDMTVNLAQFLVDQAKAQPPVCRHLLQDACYRADCQFSHDLDSHTCIFWMRGRCNQSAQACRFLHGFAPNLLQVEVIDQMEQYYYGSTAAYNPQQDYGAGAEPPMALDQGVPHHNQHYGYGGTQQNDPWQQQHPPTDYYQHSGQSSTPAAPTSFANVALQNFNQASSYTHTSRPNAAVIRSANAEKPAQSASGSVSRHPATVRIPQHLWKPHEQRDVSAFSIPDPMERYHHVNKNNKTGGNKRQNTNGGNNNSNASDVIDLHFQSTKTFPVVLETVLSESLEAFSQVWVVTGTGHHVSMQSHQKTGGALESAVMSWLTEGGYHYSRGKDRGGQGGAILVYRT